MKAMDEEKWITEMRERMKDYSEPLPEGLWDKLEKELNTSKISVFRKIWYAAAVVLLLLASSLTVWFRYFPRVDSESQKVAVQETTTHPEEAEETSPNVPAAGNHVLADAALPPVEEKHPGLSSVFPSTDPQQALLTDNENEEIQKSSSIKDERKNGEQANNGTDNTNKPVEASRAADRERMLRNAYELKAMNKKEKKKEKFSVGLLAGNTPYSSSNTYNGMGSLAAVSSYQVGNLMGEVGDEATAESQILFENRGLTTQTNVNHHLPVTVGASFRWNLNEDWALETGFMYTLLVSDLHTGETAYKEDEQRLHYVGIPLKVQRSIWKNNRFAFYGSAGGAVEKCVSGKVNTVWVTSGGTRTEETSSLDIDQLQWSVTAALGVQVNFTHQLGLYVEPGMAYYFDDNSGIETIRKEHPFNFNLQLGLRFSIGR